jgi:type VI secretion system lysozyme-like protein
VREPRPIPGLKTPLFDRLLDDSESVRQPVSPSRAVDLRTLRESVRDDISRLLNTRTNLRGELKLLASGTVLDYGVPNFSHIAPNSQSQQYELAAIFQKIITHYEPRLRSVKVVIQQDKKDPRALLGAIFGTLVFGNITEPVYFPLALDASAKDIQVEDGVSTE